MTAWPETKLSEIAGTTSGGTPDRKNSDYFGGSIPWIKSGELEDGFLTGSEEKITELALQNSAAKLLPVGTLLIAMYGATVGKTAILRIDAATNQAICAITPKKELVDTEFLRFVLLHQRPEILKQRYGGAQPNISQQIIRNLSIPIPSLTEQRKIAGVLGLVQRAMERQKRLLALTAELKKALLQQLFTNGLHNEPQKQTEIGPIPQSWSVVPLGILMDEDPKNGLYKHSSHYGTGTLILRINDFSNDGDIVVGASNRAQIDEEEHKTYCLRKDDIVVNRVNSLSHLGKTAVVGELSEPMVFESNMMRFRADSSKVLPHFLLRWMNSPVFKAQVIGSAKRAVAQSSINQGNLKAINLPLPSLEEQAEIVFYFDQIEAKLSLHRRKHAALSALFRTLLYHLMTAQVRLNDLDLSELEMKG